MRSRSIGIVSYRFCWCLAVTALLCHASSTWARTVVVDDTECRRMAIITALAPRLSWAGAGSGSYFHNFNAELNATPISQPLLLIQFPLVKVPEGMRVTSAELVFTSSLIHPDNVRPRLHVRRIVGDWGPGVCHLYRRARPEKVPWTLPGAAALGADRARRPTAVIRLKDRGEHTVNVTEDVELWCSGAAKNDGWMIYLDDPRSMVRIFTPPWTPKSWKLRITFEPR